MYRVKRSVYSYRLVFPWLLIYLIFFIVPSVGAFYYAFTNWNIFRAEFIGFANFVEIFSNPDLSIAFKNTFIFTFVSVTLKLFIALGLALILNQKLITRNFIRTVFFIPVVLSYVAVGYLFSALLHPEVGFVNKSFRFFGLNFLALDWLVNKDIVIISIALIDVWKGIGFHLAIFLAGLQSIPTQYYEAGSVDGVNAFQRFFYITFPLLRANFNANVVLALVHGLKVFDIVYVTTQGGPGRFSEVLRTLVFRIFSMGLYGLATAGELLLFILVVGGTLILQGIFRRREVEV